MRKTAILVGILVVVAGVVPAYGQAGGDNPPRIDDVTFFIARYHGGFDPAFGFAYQYFYFLYGLFPFWDDPVPFDPYTELAKELDIIFVELQVSDADLAAAEADVKFFYRLRAYAASLGPPEPPPINEGTVGYEGAVWMPLPPPPANTVIIEVSFLVPEFQGVNQKRLRGLIDWDVVWDIEIRVANEQEPEAGKLDFTDFPLYAIENTLLAPANPPPFADAGGDQTVVVGSTATLDGRGSFDSSNVGFAADDPNVFQKDTLTYVWEWISGPVRVDPVDDNDGNSATVKVTLDRVGTYVYRLLVSDGVTPVPSSDSVTINVVSLVPENRAPRAVIAGPANTVVVGSIIQLNGTGSTDPDGDQLTYRWQQTNELGGQLSPDEVKQSFQALKGVTSPIVAWQATTTGTFYFRLLVTDPGGLSDTQLTSVEVVESAATAKTAGDVAAESAGATPETTSASDTGSTPTTPKGCGGGLLPLAVLPCLLWLIRGRLR